MGKLNDIYDQLESKYRASGFFDAVPMHEPKSAPGAQRTAATFFQNLRPARAASGLAATSARLEVVTRIYTGMFQSDGDVIDPLIYDAVDLLFKIYHDDFDLGGTVRSVDVFGAHGEPLQARAGYINQDGRLYRVVDVTCPLIIDNEWDQIR